jgi:hypothetical protein
LFVKKVFKKINGYMTVDIKFYYMTNFFRLKNISLINIIIGISFTIVASSIILSSAEISKGTSSSFFSFPQTLAQQSTFNQKEHTIAQASGYFANNQIKDGIVTWIQGGLWNLQIKSLPNNNNNSIYNKSNNTSEKPNMTANFNANFTMIKPDGSLSHSHLINNFSSNDVIFAGNDIIVTGIADIHSNDAGLEFKQVPITVHLMGKKVLGLMINVSKTNGHFASANEMFGTLISGIGLNKSDINSTTITNASNNKVSAPLNKSVIK